ncbi:amino acid ABC transporter permease [Pseudovibrio japonicus]|uniref:Amino acid ABC transporter permease n=1 Tax=Pseudovibrio japonicus TaxID=366534 RepID=A0ABQ3DXL9_9HYPH|nr:ABC transporter permease [Pseudovibrio japonicus]GHB18894.1 amino acid ABC transporter permease [Pseudovibrio japonicus]
MNDVSLPSQQSYVQPKTIEPQTPPPAPKHRPWTSTRVVGTTWLTLWIAAGLGIIWFLLNSNHVALVFGGEGLLPVSITHNATFLSRYGEKFISGFFVTLQLVSVSMLLGVLLSIPLTIMRMSKSRILGGIAYAYVYFFRGTPLLAQVFLLYYGAGSFREPLQSVDLWWFFRDAWNCAILAFTLNTAAYQVEILRGSIESMPKGQWEAADALGLPKWLTFWKIILPQALIVSLRPYGNEIILMIKGSAIVAIITIYDLMGETRRAFSRTYDFQAYVWAAIAYLVMVETLRRAWDRIEDRLTRHLKR